MHLTCALVQSNSIAGFTDANVARVKAFYDIAVTQKADLVIFPEMTVTGYPIEDLALSNAFQAISMEALETLAKMTVQGAAMLVGGLWREGEAVHNAAFLLDDGKIIYRQYKRNLPDYGVFDEKRVFTAGPMPEPLRWRTISIGLLICEDMWSPEIPGHLKNQGAQLLIAMNASPYETDKPRRREAVAIQRAQETGIPLIYVNHAGAQDELVFDGGSFAVSAQGDIGMRLPSFREEMGMLALQKQDSGFWLLPGLIAPPQIFQEATYHAMMTGLRDFVQKNGFAGVVLGLSGGIDSALSAAVACDALGNDKVRCVMLPSGVTSRESIEDASEYARRLGVRLDTVSIEKGMQAFSETLSASLGGTISSVAAENNQPRLRAGILMAISQKDNLLLLSTGNKSEMAVGYTTLYGDMCGHFSVLKDIYKTTVYEVARWRNLQSESIPERIFTKAPSAELRPDQKDQDALPPYALLDAILLQLVEHNRSAEEVIAQGFERSVVERVSHMLFAAEFKRRQACPGVKISPMAFHRDRRYPLASGWRGMRIMCC